MPYLKEISIEKLIDELLEHHATENNPNRDPDFHKDKVKEVKQEIIRRVNVK